MSEYENTPAAQVQAAPMRRFRRSLTRRVLTRFVVAIVLYTILVFVGLFVSVMVCAAINWDYTNPIYRLLQWISSYLPLVVIIVLAAGYIVLFMHYWARTLGYLEDIVSATEQIYKSGNEPISLPDDLQVVENQMNRIKLDMLASRRAAQEADQRKNDLVVYLAHDLKTPLTSVIGYLTLLRDEHGISPELREHYLSVALDKAERLEDLINEFFDITRFSLTSLTLELKTVSLSRMLEQTADEFAPLLAEKCLACRVLAPPDVSITCDPDKLERVFDNLLRNAINYSHEDTDITITLAVEGETARLTFTNEGDDIPKHKLERIFEQFYRLDTARGSRTGGAGLGLAIAKEIVELHGGTISAESANGLITFRISLPLHP